MSVLTAVQSATVRLIGQRVATVFSASDTLSLEMQDLSNEAAQDIAQHQDWRALVLRATVAGDGTTTDYPFPPGYNSMILTGQMHPSMWPTWRHQQVTDLDYWEDLLRRGIAVSPGYWIILPGGLSFFPAIPAGQSASYWYTTDYYASEPNGIPKPAFTADTDLFRLPERLLTLSIIWKWRQQKRLEYAEDMANYEKALAKHASRDRGPTVYRMGHQRGANNAGWPVTDWW